ncbi:MAG: OmpA family protein [Thermodesulfobacteriota bacterium]|nr:OmpA family protein [Thermodesulfobacteriota bacterium]
MKKYYINGLFLLMISTLVLSCGGKTVQKTAPSFEPYKFNANQYEPKVDNFVVILDTSYSMNHKYGQKKKVEIAKEFLAAMNETLPELNYNGALITFGHDDSIMADYGPTQYSTSGFGSALNATKKPSGNSSYPLADAINAAAGDLESSQSQIPVIIVSDGDKMNQAPVKAAEALKAKLGDRLCIYTVLVGDDPAGKKILDQIAKAGVCGYSTTADSLASSGSMAGFVEGMFLAKPAPKPVAEPMDSDGDGVPDDLDKCPNTPKGATVDARGCWTYAAVVMYNFDSAEIKSEAFPMLDEAVSILKKNPELKVEVDGHTDNIGSAEYNLKLSERRANAVMEYFVDKGVEAERLTIKGFGLTMPAVSNDTKEGRAKNRRVTLTPVK